MKKRQVIFTAVILIIAIGIAIFGFSRKASTEEMAKLRKEFQRTGSLVAKAQHCGSNFSPTGIELLLIEYAEKRGANSRQKSSLAAFYDYGYKKTARKLREHNCTFAERETSIQTMNRKMLLLKP